MFASWPEDRVKSIAPGMRVLELVANRRELSGSRQSINVIEHVDASGAWFLRTEVSAECWGDVRPRHIDALIANGNLLHGPGSDFETARHAGSLALAPGLVLLEDGALEDGTIEVTGRFLLKGDGRTLIRMVPLDGELAQALRTPAEASEGAVREALRRGWLWQGGK